MRASSGRPRRMMLARAHWRLHARLHGGLPDRGRGDGPSFLTGLLAKTYGQLEAALFQRLLHLPPQLSPPIERASTRPAGLVTRWRLNRLAAEVDVVDVGEALLDQTIIDANAEPADIGPWGLPRRRAQGITASGRAAESTRGVRRPYHSRSATMSCRCSPRDALILRWNFGSGHQAGGQHARNGRER
jgi:hypothetical protein